MVINLLRAGVECYDLKVTVGPAEWHTPLISALGKAEAR